MSHSCKLTFLQIIDSVEQVLGRLGQVVPSGGDPCQAGAGFAGQDGGFED